MKTQKWSRTLVAAVLAAAAVVHTLPASAGGTLPVTDAAVSVVRASSASVSIIDAAGVNEAAYAEWGAVTNAAGYNVYVDGTQIDSMLIRQYPDRFRADAVGLKAGSHTLKIVPVISGKEDTSKAAEKSVTVTAHDRSGFGWAGGGTSSGAYNEDGTLKSNATVVYVTNDNKDSVRATLLDKKGQETTVTGVKAILDNFKSNVSVLSAISPTRLYWTRAICSLMP